MFVMAVMVNVRKLISKLSGLGVPVFVCAYTCQLYKQGVLINMVAAASSTVYHKIDINCVRFSALFLTPVLCLLSGGGFRGDGFLP